MILPSTVISAAYTDSMGSVELCEKIHPRKYFRDFLLQNSRVDGRSLTGLRPIQINIDPVGPADGSSVVKIGNTTVICGVKAYLGQPQLAEPDKGFLVTNVEFLPMSSPQFRPTAPGRDAQVCSKTLSDILESSGCLDMSDLCIIKEKLAWVLYCDVTVVDYDGCVLDAALMATILALKQVCLPKIAVHKDIGTYDVQETMKVALTIKSLPVALSFISFDGKLIADPTDVEESLSERRFNIAVANSNLLYVNEFGVASDKVIFQSCLDLVRTRERDFRQILSGFKK